MRLRKLTDADIPPVQSVQRFERCLYVIAEEGCDDHFKIGIAGHPARRLSALQGGNRRRLRIVTAYAGSDADCCFAERAALRFFKAKQGTEWVCERLETIINYLDAFCEVKK